jgi:hypothetical protein
MSMNISDRLMDLIFSAVEQGLMPLKRQQALVPFVMCRTKRGVVLSRFTHPHLDDALEKAYAHIRTLDTDTLAYALIYDGIVSVEDQDIDAVLVEAGERGQADGWRFAQRYQPAGERTPLYTIGDLAYLGQAAQLLTSP